MVSLLMVSIQFTNKMDRLLLYLPVFGLGIAMEILFEREAGKKRLEWKRSGSPTQRVSPKYKNCFFFFPMVMHLNKR
tara:strand:- start:18787 stop:19017 length:231 start_codon:yes stop_codon:yes gene_type:complete